MYTWIKIFLWFSPNGYRSPVFYYLILYNSAIFLSQSKYRIHVWFRIHEWLALFSHFTFQFVPVTTMKPIFCGNFEYDARQSDLERLFGKYGKVDRVDMKSGKHRFISFLYLHQLAMETQVTLTPLAHSWYFYVKYKLKFRIHFVMENYFYYKQQNQSFLLLWSLQCSNSIMIDALEYFLFNIE